MNSSFSVLPKVSSATGGPTKSTKRKRKRTKSHNYYLKRRRFRKLIEAKKNNSQLSNFHDTSNTELIMSNWYWYNYNKSLEWQDRHQLAHWKATALALLEENRYLLEVIKHMQPGVVPEASISQSNLHNVSNTNKSECKISPSENAQNQGTSTFKYHLDREEEEEEDEEGGEEDEENVRYEEDVEDEDDEEDEEDEDNEEDEEDEGDDNNEENEDESSDFELEMSKEMMQFFEQSQKRKIELEKLKEKEKEEKTEKDLNEIKSNKIKRTSEMKFLYGEGAAMITGMETAVQLGFNKYCDYKSPKFWPNIPFRL